MVTGNDVILYFSNKYKSNWDEVYEAIRRKDDLDDNEIVKIKQSLKNKYVTILDDAYPEYLKKINRPPFILFYKGNLKLLNYGSNHRIAIVGSRKCSNYGVNATNFIVDNLPKDYLVISGLAKGIDAISHQASLKNKLKTIAVLGGGIEKFYPAENKELLDRILANDGLVISEYLDDVEPKPDNFVMRNRIISGLCDFLLVTEAYKRSGTSITVSYALNQGKDVGCIPYEICKDSLCNTLLKEGAYFIETAEDITKIVR